ncbi:hypothetical protein LXL04_040135 [Taraxacum kok-saghyz]
MPVPSNREVGHPVLAYREADLSYRNRAQSYREVGLPYPTLSRRIELSPIDKLGCRSQPYRVGIELSPIEKLGCRSQPYRVGKSVCLNDIYDSGIVGILPLPFRLTIRNTLSMRRGLNLKRAVPKPPLPLTYTPPNMNSHVNKEELLNSYPSHCLPVNCVPLTLPVNSIPLTDFSSSVTASTLTERKRTEETMAFDYRYFPGAIEFLRHEFTISKEVLNMLKLKAGVQQALEGVARSQTPYRKVMEFITHYKEFLVNREVSYEVFRNVDFHFAKFNKMSYVECRLITDQVLSAFENVYPFKEINIPIPTSINPDDVSNTKAALGLGIIVAVFLTLGMISCSSPPDLSVITSQDGVKSFVGEDSVCYRLVSSFLHLDTFDEDGRMIDFGCMPTVGEITRVLFNLALMEFDRRLCHKYPGIVFERFIGLVYIACTDDLRIDEYQVWDMIQDLGLSCEIDYTEPGDEPLECRQRMVALDYEGKLWMLSREVVERSLVADKEKKVEPMGPSILALLNTLNPYGLMAVAHRYSVRDFRLLCRLAGAGYRVLARLDHRRPRRYSRLVVMGLKLLSPSYQLDFRLGKGQPLCPEAHGRLEYSLLYGRKRQWLNYLKWYHLTALSPLTSRNCLAVRGLALLEDGRGGRRPRSLLSKVGCEESMLLLVSVFIWANIAVTDNGRLVVERCLAKAIVPSCLRQKLVETGYRLTS